MPPNVSFFVQRGAGEFTGQWDVRAAVLFVVPFQPVLGGGGGRENNQLSMRTIDNLSPKFYETPRHLHPSDERDLGVWAELPRGLPVAGDVVGGVADVTRNLRLLNVI